MYCGREEITVHPLPTTRSGQTHLRQVPPEDVRSQRVTESIPAKTRLACFAYLHDERRGVEECAIIQPSMFEVAGMGQVHCQRSRLTLRGVSQVLWNSVQDRRRQQSRLTHWCVAFPDPGDFCFNNIISSDSILQAAEMGDFARQHK
jgi:hypothetical protein